MSETLSSPIHEENTPSVSKLEEMFNAQEHEAVSDIEQPQENPEVSPAGSSILRAATRINALLEKRAITKAHSDALSEYRDRDYDGYISHLANVADSTEASPAAKATAEMAIEREWRREDREKALENAKDTARKFGRSAIRRLKDVGLLSLGVGVASAEATGAGVKKALSATESGINSVKDRYNDMKLRQSINKAHSEALVEDRQRSIDAQEDAYASYEDNLTRSNEIDTAYKMNDAFDAQKAKEQAAIDKSHEKALKMNEKFDRIKERKAAALARRAARRATWASAMNTLKETIKNGVETTQDFASSTAEKARTTYESSRDKAADTTERAKAKARLYRSAGRQALATYREVINENR